MRKYLLSTSILSSLFSAWGVVQQTRRGPRDWRLGLHWVIWLCTLAIAIGTVAKKAEHTRGRFES